MYNRTTRLLPALLFCLIISFIFPQSAWGYGGGTSQQPEFSASAESDPVGEDAGEISWEDSFSRLNQAAGGDELPRSLPEETRDLLEDAGLSDITPGSFLQMTPESFWQTIWSLLQQKMKQPVSLLGLLLGGLLLGGVLELLQQSFGFPSAAPVYHLMTVLFFTVTIVTPFLETAQKIRESIQSSSNFLSAFIPVFTGVLTVSGSPGAATSYHVFVFFGVQVVSQLVSRLLLPGLGVYLALSVAGAASPDSGLKVQPVAGLLQSVMTWGLGLLLTLFIGLLSLQSLVSTSLDSLTVKTSRFLIGSFVPVIGGALSEAFATAQGCAKLLKTTVGVYGVLGLGFTVLPVLLESIIWRLLFQVGEAAAELLELAAPKELMKACKTAAGLLFSLVLLYLLLTLLATGVVLLISGLGG